MQAPRPRRQHTAVAIKKAQPDPAAHLHPESLHPTVQQTLGVLHGAAIKLPAGFTAPQMPSFFTLKKNVDYSQSRRSFQGKVRGCPDGCSLNAWICVRDNLLRRIAARQWATCWFLHRNGQN